VRVRPRTCRTGNRTNVPDRASIAATAYGQGHDQAKVLEGLQAVYPFVLARLLQWAALRDHSSSVDNIGRTLSYLDLPAFR